MNHDSFVAIDISPVDFVVLRISQTQYKHYTFEDCDSTSFTYDNNVHAIIGFDKLYDSLITGLNDQRLKNFFAEKFAFL